MIFNSRSNFFPFSIKLTNLLCNEAYFRNRYSQKLHFKHRYLFANEYFQMETLDSACLYKKTLHQSFPGFFAHGVGSNTIDFHFCVFPRIFSQNKHENRAKRRSVIYKAEKSSANVWHVPLWAYTWCTKSYARPSRVCNNKCV